MSLMISVWAFVLFFCALAFPGYAGKFFKNEVDRQRFYEDFNRAYARVGESYEKLIRQWNPKLSSKQVRDIASSVIFYTMYFNRERKVLLDPRLVMAVIKVESNFRLRAVSAKGAMGLGQLMSSTAASVGLSSAHLFHPVYNIYGTVRVLRSYFDRWHHLPYPQQYLFALASYNAGPNAVAKYGGVPPYRETINYVRKVTLIYKKLAPELFR